MSRHNGERRIWVVMSRQASFQILAMQRGDSYDRLQQRLRGESYLALNCMSDYCRYSRKWQVMTDRQWLEQNNRELSCGGWVDDA